VWPRAGLALELALLAAAIVAGLLTAATLIVLKTGTVRLIEPTIAVRAWLVVGGLAAVGATFARWLPAATIAHHRRPLLLVLTAALAWTLVGLARPMLRAGDGLTAHYFANETWDGWPVRSLVDTQISTARMRERWNGVPPERFSARWQGYLTVGRAGRYRFTTTSDDGSLLYINDTLVVDNGGPHSTATKSGEIQLMPGSHRVRLDYVQFGADAELRWTWARDGGDAADVPAWALSRRPAGLGKILVARAVDFTRFVCTLLVLLAVFTYVRRALAGDTVREVVDRITAAVTSGYCSQTAFVFSVTIFIAVLCMPWPGGRGQPSFENSVRTTIQSLHDALAGSLADFAVFQARINTPRSGEDVLPNSVREIVAMLDEHRVDRYQLSQALANDTWVFQQIVASAWPRKLEGDAPVRFVLNTEPTVTGCSLVARLAEISLVRCP
jgi:hypothetical protein